MTAPLPPAAALRRIAFLLERAREPSYRVGAFRTAAAVVDTLDDAELDRRIRTGTLKDLKGIGPKTATAIVEAHRGAVPEYLARLEATHAELVPLADDVAEFRAALRGDLHVHSDWSDGGSPIREMAEAAIGLGHEYMALTDHSPRLTVANGLSAERLEKQLDAVAALNAELAPFRILTGIECDITVEGDLDQTDELLGRLDVVVASVHSDLRADSASMTARMLAAVANPHTDVLGHCTGRLVIGRQQRNGSQRPRPESQFDAEAVFGACIEHGTAVEINSRPERLDPPLRLLRLAVELGCEFSIDTDAHAPGQLDWQGNGCERAVETGVPVERVINTWAADDLLAWTTGR
ncbi:MAG: PHP domain-containing protein [Blastococcus sp.]